MIFPAISVYQRDIQEQKHCARNTKLAMVLYDDDVSVCSHMTTSFVHIAQWLWVICEKVAFLNQNVDLSIGYIYIFVKVSALM